MGPLLLIDKSAIQSFSPAETNALHRHYSVITCPILIQEIKANLVKHPEDPALSQNKVATLADKADGFGGFTIDHHNVLCYASLMGAQFRLWPQIPRFDGKEEIDKHGRRGVVFEEAPERKSLARMANKDFSEEDFEQAKRHVQALSETDLEAIHKENISMFPENTAVKSFLDLVSFLDNPRRDSQKETLSTIEAIMKALQFSEVAKQRVRHRWEVFGRPSMRQFSEYGHYFHRVDILFHVGLTAGLIPTSRRSKAIIDYQYLFYAPFAHAFCSGDSFHREFSKHLLRPDQEFIWAADLKKDLKVISDCHASMSATDRKWYIRNFGNRPPPIRESLTVQLWETFIGPWKMGSGNRAADIPPEDHKRIIEQLEAGFLPPELQ